jgi:hypothetical protein
MANITRPINISKCAVLSISSRVPATLHRYFIHGISIPHLDTSCVDLGVTISHNLDFKVHINKIVSRSRQRTCMLFRGFTSRNIDIRLGSVSVFFNSVSVFGISLGTFSKSVRFSVSIFFNTAVSLRFFGFFF